MSGPQVHTSCDKYLEVERGEHGTRIVLTEPERTFKPEQSMWANLSPRDVGELVDALLTACPRGVQFAPAIEALAEIARVEGRAESLNAEVHEVDDDADAELLATRAIQWEKEAARLRLALAQKAAS